MSHLTVALNTIQHSHNTECKFQIHDSIHDWHYVVLLVLMHIKSLFIVTQKEICMTWIASSEGHLEKLLFKLHCVPA